MRLWAVLVGLAAVLFLAAPAQAHAVLLSTDPADGQVVPVAPQQVRLVFNEPVQVGAVRLLDAAGSDTGATSRGVDATVVIEVPAGLANGTYIVSWRVISADTHPVAGGFTFSIGAPSSGTVAVPASPEPSVLLRLTRQVTEALGYLGTLGTAGLAVFLLLWAPPETRSRVRRLMYWAAGIAFVALAATIVVTPVWQSADWSTWRTGFGSDTALASLLTAAGLIMALNRIRLIAFAGIGLALGALAIVGHTRTFGPAWLVLTSDMLHVSTAAVWLGGIAGLVLTLAPRAALAPATAARTVSRFSAGAAGLVAVLATAGVVLGWRILGSWEAVFGTGYGITLLVKVGIAAAVVSIAAVNRFRLLPMVLRQQDAWRALRVAVWCEAGLLAAIVATTGVLVTQSPTLQTGVTTPATLTAQGTLGQGKAVITITPGTVGVNSLELTLVNADGTPIEPIADPRLRVTLPARDVGPLNRPLSRTGPGRYEAVADFPLSGTWTVDVSVRISTFDNPVAQLHVDIP